MADLGPFMPLYVDDFLGGTLAFGADEVGAYLLLLAHQWAEGSIEDDDRVIRRISRFEGPTLVRVLAKFQKGEDGRLRNARLESIRADRFGYVESRRNNASKGWERKRSTERMQSVCKADAEHVQGNPSPLPIRENIYTGNPPKQEKPPEQIWTVEDFRAASVGVAIKPVDVDSCFHHYAAVGFVDGAGRRITNVKSLLAKWAAAQPSRGRTADRAQAQNIEVTI